MILQKNFSTDQIIRCAIWGSCDHYRAVQATTLYTTSRLVQSCIDSGRIRYTAVFRVRIRFFFF